MIHGATAQGWYPSASKRRNGAPTLSSNTVLDTESFSDHHAERRSMGNVSVGMAEEQRRIWQRQIKEGSYIKRQPKTCAVADLFEPYMLDFNNRGARDARRRKLAWKHLKPVSGH